MPSPEAVQQAPVLYRTFDDRPLSPPDFRLRYGSVTSRDRPYEYARGRSVPACFVLRRREYGTLTIDFEPVYPLGPTNAEADEHLARAVFIMKQYGAVLQRGAAAAGGHNLWFYGLPLDDEGVGVAIYDLIALYRRAWERIKADADVKIRRLQYFLGEA